MKRCRVVGAAAIVLLIGASGLRAVPSDEVRVRNLEILGEVWGRLHLLHPRIASEGLNFVQVLTAAIPRVEAAETPEQLADALNATVLSVLDDPLTLAQPRTVSADRLSGSMRLTFFDDLAVTAGNRRREAAPDGPALVRRVGQTVGVLDATRPRGFGTPGFARDLDALASRLDGLGTLIVDLRFSSPWQANLGWLNSFVREPAVSGGVVSRVRRGWCETANCGPYAQDWYVTPGQTFRRQANRPTLTVPLVILVNNTSYSQCAEILDVLQHTADARVVLETTGVFLANGANTIQFPEGVEVRLGAQMLLSKSGELGVKPDLVVSRHVGDDELPSLAERSASASRTAKRQPFNLSMTFADDFPASSEFTRELRLAGWMKLWTAVSFLFPQVSYASVDWSKELGKQIPAIEAAGTIDQYFERLRRITAPLNDSHVLFSGERAGQFSTTLPALLRLIDGKAVVFDAFPYPDGTMASIRAGDTIVETNGTPADEIITRMRPLIAASTPGGLNRYLANWVAATGNAKTVSIVVEGSGGRRRLEVPTYPTSAPYGAQKNYRILDGNIGYLPLNRMPIEKFYEAFDALRLCAGVILDPRSGVDGTFDILPHFLARPARYMDRRTPLLLPGFSGGLDYHGTLAPDPVDRYTGPLVVLIDEGLQSNSENFAFVLKTERRARFVGSQTAGTTGDMTQVRLPLGASMSFTGTRVTWPDGSRFQNVGIVPDVRASLTIAGLRQGRDDVLEAGIREMKRLIQKKR